MTGYGGGGGSSSSSSSRKILFVVIVTGADCGCCGVGDGVNKYGSLVQLNCLSSEDYQRRAL
jgi:hypothetical protein